MSLSPGTRCAASDVEAEILARARRLGSGTSFRVTLRQRGAGVASPVQAAQRGARVLAGRPDLRVESAAIAGGSRAIA